MYSDSRWLVRELFWRRLEALIDLLGENPRKRVLDFGGGNGILLGTFGNSTEL